MLSRDPERARASALGADADSSARRGRRWDPLDEPAPARGAGGPRRRGAPRRRADRAALERARPSARSATAACAGTRNLVDGLRASSAPRRARAVLVSSSAVGYYGAHGEEPLDEEAPAGRGLPRAGVRRLGGARRAAATALGMRVVQVRTGVVLDARRRRAREDAAAVPARRRRPGRGRAPVHLVDPPRRPRRDDRSPRSSDERWSGPVNATAPEPVTQPRLLARARARAAPARRCCRCRALALRALYGEMAEIVTDGRARRARPSRSCSATSSATRSSTRRCARRSGAASARRRRAHTRAAARSAAQRALARGAVLGLDDHAARALAEQVGGRRPDPLLAGRRVDRRPVDDVGSRPVRLPRRAPRRGCACGSGPVWILMPSAARLDARALEHRAPVRLLVLEARLERELARHRQHEDRVHDAVLADQLGGAAQRAWR